MANRLRKLPGCFRTPGSLRSRFARTRQLTQPVRQEFITASRAEEPPMLRRTAALGLFAAAVVALTGDPAPVAAQDKPIEEAFFTADGVKLRGLFHTSSK